MSDRASMLKELDGIKALFVDDKLELHKDDIYELEQYGLEVSTCETAFDIPERLDDPKTVFDIVIMDLYSMTQGLKTFQPHRDLQPLIEKYPDLPFIIFSVEDEKTQQYEDKGARAYVLKEDGIGELINALIHILVLKKQSVYWSKSIRSKKVLSQQESKVLGCAGRDGLASKEIARKLGLSKHTVDGYLKGIKKKLGTNDTKHSVATAYERGLI